MNGVAERANRTLLDLTRSMLRSSRLPKGYWTEAVTTAAYVRNRVSNLKVDNETPLGMWINHAPRIGHLKIFGCLAYAKLPKQGTKKLDSTTVPCILVGYATNPRGYRLWCPEKKDVITTKHVRFCETVKGYCWFNKTSESQPRYEDIWSDNGNDILIENFDDEEIEVESQSQNENVQEAEGTKETVGAEDAVNNRPRRGRPLKRVKNPYGRKGKPTRR